MFSKISPLKLAFISLIFISLLNIFFVFANIDNLSIKNINIGLLILVLLLKFRKDCLNEGLKEIFFTFILIISVVFSFIYPPRGMSWEEKNLFDAGQKRLANLELTNEELYWDIFNYNNDVSEYGPFKTKAEFNLAYRQYGDYLLRKLEASEPAIFNDNFNKKIKIFSGGMASNQINTFFAIYRNSILSWFGESRHITDNYYIIPKSRELEDIEPKDYAEYFMMIFAYIFPYILLLSTIILWAKYILSTVKRSGK